MRGFRYVLLVCATVSAMTGLPASPAAIASANTVEQTSMGGANLLSYADSDFESGVGNWVAVSNANLSQDTHQAFLHDASLQDVVSSAQPSQFALNGKMEIDVEPGQEYRAGGYFKVPAAAGQTITWAVQAFDSAGDSQGWVSGTPAALNDTGAWQYASAVLTMPAGAAYLLGSPQVTYAGGLAGRALHMDEVQFTPNRAAELIGADGGHDGSVADWMDANNKIGPLQSDKVFYRKLPASFSGSMCDELPAPIVCFVDYQVMNTNLTSFVSGIPASRTVVMIFRGEPEGKTYNYHGKTAGPAYVAEFEHEARLVRAAAKDAPNVFIAMDASAYGYRPGGPGLGCSFIPPSRYVDFYLIDHYQLDPNGSSVSQGTGTGPGEWQAWLSCVRGYGKPIGLAEYGLGTCGTQVDALRQDSITATAPYLESLPGSSTLDAPVLVWSYWWVNESHRSRDQCEDWQFTGPPTIRAWHTIEMGS
jgi:hypothetical protein